MHVVSVFVTCVHEHVCVYIFMCMSVYPCLYIFMLRLYKINILSVDKQIIVLMNEYLNILLAITIS